MKSFSLATVLFLVAGALPFSSRTLFVHGDTADGDAALIAEVIEWAKSNGAYINEKVEIKHIAGDLSGIFAKEPLKEGEIATSIPWRLIIQGPRYLGRNFCAGVEGAIRALKTDPEYQSPYVRYLATRPRNFHPAFWSEAGRKLLQEMMGKDLPPGNMNEGVQKHLDHFKCDDMDTSDDDVLQAIMLTMTRTEGDSYDHLVPFNDVINHRNGKDYTADPVYNIGENYQIVARRDLEAGEEIRNSYNKCEWCHAFQNPPAFQRYLLTPHIFDHYGFIEPFPQRWIVPNYRLLFDVEELDNESGRLKATFAIPPSPLGVSFLKSEIERLESMKGLYDGEIKGIPDIELNTIRDYHDAILTAYKVAHEQAQHEELSDEVWYKGRDDWYWEEEKDDDN